ncbi:MAG TPA: CmcI family methyltransferase [Puia sp.]|jgi:glycosyltransferase involved in cell wall biosynthesis|nr:CmcI family methyltransferase [Puia sp.]
MIPESAQTAVTTATQEPFVSCIMPTYNRRSFVPHAIRYFQRQEYQNKELIIIDDGTDCVEDLLPEDTRIRYYRLGRKISLGAKLNMACDYASYDIIVNWDDDDWYAPHRLKYQVETLRNRAIDICGINNLLYYDLRSHRAFNYIYPLNQRVWLLGSSLCFNRSFWELHHFEDINVGMDGLFVWKARPDQVAALPDPSFSVHMIHGDNVSPKHTNAAWWHPFPLEKIKNLMNSDWHYYSNGFFSDPPATFKGHTVEKTAPPVPSRQLRNIYACLVHENEDCVIDLVRNLHYHDPGSVILLYNGGNDSNLLKQGFRFEKFGAVIHPTPAPMKHGYLHGFALDCMAYALDHLSFDIMTIVDSDQLCVRSGYAGYLSTFFSARPDAKIGMLSSKPERVKADNKTNQVAMMAFREYNLWKPFLDSIPGAADKFVHWTFWPATVFTADAARDLVRLFQENRQLQEIMAMTKIWATEEVILPTLVRILGYEIAANPCSYDFVKYKKIFSTPDLRYCLGKADAYWMHPIDRRYDNPVRQQIRHIFEIYQTSKTIPVTVDMRTSDLLLPNSIMTRIRKIEGWLTDAEAELLLAATLKACIALPAPHSLVEIGSYQGKSTVLMASVACACSSEAKVYAIDPHEGMVGAADQGLHSVKPSYDLFQANIREAGLSAIVETIRQYSYLVNWQKPVSLLFIDGLHDYLNVARDFRHFAEWVQSGGYIVFHDYADYYPGVRAFVDEVLQYGEYIKIWQADSLVVIQKRT